MARIILSSLAVVAMFATNTAPAASDNLYRTSIFDGIDSAKLQQSYMQITVQRHEANARRGTQTLAAAGSQSALPPTDCPPAPTQQCLDSWKVKTANPFE